MTDASRVSTAVAGGASEAFDPAEAFALIGDETRVAILEALADADDPLPFGRLREAVGVDDSGRFNYHLGKLADRFVRKTGDGYELTYAGMRVVGAVYEGTYAKGRSVGPFELDTECPLCDGAVTFEYADERVSIACQDCGQLETRLGFPPGAVAGREPEDLPQLLSRHMYSVVERLTAGFCVNCSGPVRLTVAMDDDDDPYAEVDCERCGEHARMGLASAVMTHPAVVSFVYDHGIDLRQTHLWDLDWLVSAEENVERLPGDPPRWRLSARLDDEALVLDLDEHATVVAVDRHPAGE